MGYEKKERSYLKDEDKFFILYYEVGYGLVSMLLFLKDKVFKIIIILIINGVGGYILIIFEDKNYYRIDYLKNKIKVLFGGRVVEEIIFGKDKVFIGVEGDIF